MKKLQWLAGVVALSGGVVWPDLAAAQSAPATPPSAIPVSRLDGPETPVLTPGGQSRPEQLPGLPVTQLDERARAADLDGPRTVSLTFSQPIPEPTTASLLAGGLLSLAMGRRYRAGRVSRTLS